MKCRRKHRGGMADAPEKVVIMEWQDNGIVLSVRGHGESSAIVSLLTRDHGRHAGLVRGGRSRRAAGLFEPGNTVHAVWRARLADHLGTMTCEATHFRAAALLDDADRLTALAAACAVLDSALPERLPCPDLYDDAVLLLDSLAGPHWAATYVLWESRLLAELGFGLDLARCAASGATEDLIWVSPKSGRAVSRQAGAAYAAKLLPLPAFLRTGPAQDQTHAGPLPESEILAGLRLTGYFLARRVLAESAGAGSSGSPRRPPDLPGARQRLETRIAVRNASADPAQSIGHDAD